VAGHLDGGRPRRTISVAFSHKQFLELKFNCLGLEVPINLVVDFGDMSGNRLRFTWIKRGVRVGQSGAHMANERAEYYSAWWRIGDSLRDCFEVSTEFPPNLLTLVKKLDAIEGKYLLSIQTWQLALGTIGQLLSQCSLSSRQPKQEASSTMKRVVQ
jgi:hypothetical protein